MSLDAPTLPGIELADDILAERHYLGPSSRSPHVYQDDDGVMVFANPTSRHLPGSWLELVRWCITGGPNAGSQQWHRAALWVARQEPDCTTVVSYSDPSVGHTGALYRACNWLWAPTWMRLRPPPSGNGTRSGKRQETKDRWVYLLRPDPDRERVLAVKDSAVVKAMPWASYREPTWKRGRVMTDTGGGNYQRWKRERAV